MPPDPFKAADPIDDQPEHPFWCRPLVPLTAALMAGLFLGGAFPGGFWPGVALCGAGLAAAVSALVRGRSAAVSPLAVMIGLGYLLLQPYVAEMTPTGHIAGRIDTGPCRVRGTVASVPRAAYGRQRFFLSVEGAGTEDASGLLRVTVAGEGPRIHRGDRVVFHSTIRGFRNFENPGGFDYRRYMALQNVRCSTYVTAKDLVVVEKAIPGPIDAFRRSLIAFLDRRVDAPASALLKALLVGDRQGIEVELREKFNRAGVGHILAISGLHVGIVAGTAFFALCRLFSIFPFLVRRALVRRAAAMGTVGAVVCYGLLAGMSPSTQRAVIMVATFMGGLVVGRRAEPLNTLALAALAILIWHPGALFTVSFQLSFAAAGAILYGLEADRKPAFFSGGHPRLLRRAMLFGYVSFLAILGTLPLTAYYFNRVSVVGLGANCLVIPLVGFAAVPVGLVSVVVYPVSPDAAAFGFHIAAWALDAAVWSIRLLADLPWGSFQTVTPSLLEIGICYGLLYALVNRCRGKVPLAVAVAATALGGADVCHWLQHRLWHPDLRVTAIDVGQGAATLIEFPRGKTMLIDGGGFSDNRIFDVGAAVVGPLLWRKKIRTVDVIVLTHPNSDHLNGLVFVIENFRIGEIWTNGQPADTGSYRRFLAAVTKSRAPAPDFEHLRRRRRVGGVDLAMIHPPPQFLDRSESGAFADPNNNSIVVKASFKAVSFLFPGDVMAVAEQKMAAAACEDLSATVLFAPHHGSRTSSTPVFLQCVNPEAVLVSSGWRLRRYFPHPIVEKRYRARNLSLYCTHRHGAVTVTTDGREYRVAAVVDKPPLLVGAD